MGKIEHLQCDCCGQNITSLEDGEIVYKTHFDIERSNKVFDFDKVEGTVEELEDERNRKMHRTVCEECMVKILEESPILATSIGYHQYNSDNHYIFQELEKEIEKIAQDKGLDKVSKMMFGLAMTKVKIRWEEKFRKK